MPISCSDALPRVAPECSTVLAHSDRPPCWPPFLPTTHQWVHGHARCPHTGAKRQHTLRLLATALHSQGARAHPLHPAQGCGARKNGTHASAQQGLHCAWMAATRQWALHHVTCKLPSLGASVQCDPHATNQAASCRRPLSQALHGAQLNFDALSLEVARRVLRQLAAQGVEGKPEAVSRVGMGVLHRLCGHAAPCCAWRGVVHAVLSHRWKAPSRWSIVSTTAMLTSPCQWLVGRS